MGAVMNMRPDLFRCVLTRVPFVDVMVTMSDASIPLTAIEWEEWGNPTDEKFYEYMLSYSPISNVRAQRYPNVLITTGLFDSRVAYWEPAKWVATLRKRKLGDSVVLLRCKMDQGHGGHSGRYVYLEEQAFGFAFVLDQLGIHE
jgi:oligopeptidase B